MEGESVQMVSGYIIVLEWLTNNSRIKKRSWLSVLPISQIFFSDLEWKSHVLLCSQGSESL